jgi:sulfite exporter TauE/SafE
MSDLIIAFSLGLLSAPHCIGMCGSIATALLMGAQRSSETSNAVQAVRIVTAGGPPQHAIATPVGAVHDAFLFGSGKLFAYVVLGASAGSLGLAIGALGTWPGTLLRSLSALLMIAIGLYVAGWWRGLARLESFGARIWLPALRMFGRIDMGKNTNKLFGGVLWGFLPCGIVYSVLGLALASGDIIKAAAMMASFGLGTMPFVLSAGGLMQAVGKALAQPLLKQGAGAAMILLGLVTLYLLFGINPALHSH